MNVRSLRLKAHEVSSRRDFDKEYPFAPWGEGELSCSTRNYRSIGGPMGSLRSVMTGQFGDISAFKTL